MVFRKTSVAQIFAFKSSFPLCLSLDIASLHIAAIKNGPPPKNKKAIGKTKALSQSRNILNRDSSLRRDLIIASGA